MTRTLYHCRQARSFRVLWMLEELGLDYLRYTQVEPPQRRLPQAAEDYKRFFVGRLKLIEPVLDRPMWLCGDRFTAADVSVGYALRLASTLGFNDAFKPQVQAHLDRTERRPAFERALVAEGKNP